MGALTGRTVVVTRASAQAGRLSGMLRSAGAEVIEVPTIEIVPSADGDEALRAALDASPDWVVVTSPNGADRLVAVGVPRGVKIAAIGPGTKAVLDGAGLSVSFVPTRHVGEGLIDEFGEGDGCIVVAQADRARPVVTDGLRAKGWTVVPIVAYRTVAAALDAEVAPLVAMADAVVFTSASTVEAFTEAFDRSPPVVVCIGPIAAAAARQRGLGVDAVADPHTLDGLVAATIAAIGPDSAPA